MTDHLYIQHKITLLSIYILNTSVGIIPLPTIDSHKKSEDPLQTPQKTFNDNSCLNSNLAPLRAQHLMDRKEGSGSIRSHAAPFLEIQSGIHRNRWLLSRPSRGVT